jgi:hypothetical protein
VIPSANLSITKLPRGPEAVIGEAAHKVLLEAAQGLFTPDESEMMKVVKQRIGDVLSRRTCCEEDPDGDPLTAVTPFRRQQIISQIAQAIQNLTPDRHHCGTHSSAMPSPIGADRSPVGHGLVEGTERRLICDEMQLRGKIDRIERISANEWRITDLKTGLVHDRNGNLLCEHQIQLELYGLLALSYDPKAIIHLCVIGRQAKYDWIFDRNSQQDRRYWLQSIIDRTPLDEVLLAHSLSLPGPHCAKCRIRHMCDSYLESAPNAWAQDSLDECWPADVWGRIEDIDGSGQDLVDVTLRDIASRYVRIRGLTLKNERSSLLTVGAGLALFGLQAAPLPTTRSVKYQPLNYFEASTDRRLRSAYELKVFRWPRAT